jgi:hypothetical protein
MAVPAASPVDPLAAPLEDRLCQMLRGAAGDDSSDLDAAVLEAARDHRVDLLLLDACRARVPGVSPAAGWEVLVTKERQAAVLECIRVLELRRVLDELAQSDVNPVIIKGTALAYSCYPQPQLRPREDVDLLIPRDQLDRADRTLTSLEYVRANLITGEWVMPQRRYRREWPAGVEHVCDLHWRLSNPVAFASALSFDDVVRSAVAIPELGGSARGPGDVHALFIACIHRVAHHNDSPQLVWMYDIHLLAGRLSPEQWREFEELAAARSMRAVCWRGLTLAERAFGTKLPASAVERLAESSDESSASFIGGRTGELAVQWSNWRNLPAWSDRGQLLVEHLFPSPSYVMSKYNVTHRAWLPVLYARRAVSGALRWLRQSLR